jgi:hypothetical protein
MPLSSSPDMQWDKGASMSDRVDRQRSTIQRSDCHGSTGPGAVRDGDRYAQAALRSEADRVADTPTARDDTLDLAAYRLRPAGCQVLFKRTGNRRT